MKIGIIGLGFVGSAVAYAHRHHELVIRDPKLNLESATLDEIHVCDAVYVCVPSPKAANGSCDTSCVESVLKELKNYTSVIICKSTVPPSVYVQLQQQYTNIVHSPEFLTAANAVNDYISAEWILVGGNEPWSQRAIEVIKSSDVAAENYITTNIQTAALFKYLANSFLATKVTFMNDFYHLAKSLGVDWQDITRIGVLDSRLGTSHWAVPGPDGQFGYGGACFPKDVDAIIKQAEQLDVDLHVLTATNLTNSKYRNL